MSKVLSPRLERTLREVIGPVRGLGGEAPSKRAQALRELLFAEAMRSTRIFNVVLVMILAVFVFMLYFLAVNADRPQTYVAISGAAGVSITGLIWLAMRTGRESTQATLLLILAEQLPSEDALAAMQTVLAGRKNVPAKH
jgi:hypothetical protein